MKLKQLFLTGLAALVFQGCSKTDEGIIQKKWSTPEYQTTCLRPILIKPPIYQQVPCTKPAHYFFELHNQDKSSKSQVGVDGKTYDTHQLGDYFDCKKEDCN